MKRRIWLLFLALSLLPLGGCSGGLFFRDQREIDQLVLVQTLGVDRSGKLYRVSASAGEEGEVLLRSGTVTIRRAMEEMQEYTEQKYVFYGHTRHLLLGETAARSSLRDCLSYVERDGEIRLDTNLFVVQGGTAEDLILRAERAEGNVGDLLEALARDVEILGESHVYSCGEVAEALAEKGCALAAAVILTPSDQDLSGERDTAVQGCGYAVLLDSGLCRFLDQNLSRGVNLLTGETRGDVVEAPDGAGDWFAARLTGSSASFEPTFSRGELTGLRIRIRVQCSLDEVHSLPDLSSAETIRTLEAGIAGLEQHRVEEVIRISQELGADFCGLGQSARRAAPWRFDGMETPWEEAFPTLPVVAEVTALLQRSYDGSVSPVRDEEEGGK